MTTSGHAGYSGKVAFADGAGVAVAARADITDETWPQRIDVNLGGAFRFMAQHLTGTTEGERA